MIKFKYVYNSIAILSFIIMVLAVTYMIILLTDSPKVSYKNEPFPVAGTSTIFRAGDMFRFTVNRCVDKNTFYTLTRAFVSDSSSTAKKLYMSSNDISSQEAGCKEVLGLPVTVPSDLPEGTWHVEHGVFTQGFIRNFFFTIKSQKFTIIK